MTTGIGISTSYRSGVITDGANLAKALAQLGVGAIELDNSLAPDTREKLIASISDHGLSLVSVCAMGGDDLCSTDHQLRQGAVDNVKQTISLASDIRAKAVVLHCGAVPMDKTISEFQRMYDTGTLGTVDGQRYVNDMKIMRLGYRGLTFEQLLRSLEEINKEAERQGVYIGLENRYYLRDYPDFEEMAIIFCRMDGSKIMYWHDTGYAQVQDNLGIMPHEAWLKEFSERMIGVHIHDAVGYNDRMAPPAKGKDSVDFGMLKKYIGNDMVKILKLNDGVTDQQAEASIGWLIAQGLG